jgi:Tfp pilus assembly protein PilX
MQVNPSPLQLRGERGMSMVIVVLAMFVTSMFVAAGFAVANGGLSMSVENSQRKSSYAVAEAGLGYYLKRLRATVPRCPSACCEDMRSSADQLTSGTSTIWPACAQALVSTVTRLVRRAWNLEQEQADRSGTLLGPEGSSLRSLWTTPPVNYRHDGLVDPVSTDTMGGTARNLRTTQWTRASL